MTEHLTALGYEQTSAKLTGLQGRLAEIEVRTDLSPEHREQVLRSYRQMIHQYRRELKLYEVLQDQTTQRT